VEAHRSHPMAGLPRRGGNRASLTSALGPLANENYNLEAAGGNARSRPIADIHGVLVVGHSDELIEHPAQCGRGERGSRNPDRWVVPIGREAAGLRRPERAFGPHDHRARRPMGLAPCSLWQVGALQSAPTTS
jgi:hypothetical protein